MARIRLVGWNAEATEERAAVLRSLGHDVDAAPVTGGTIRELPRSQVDVFVVDLTRLPSHGRDAGVALRRAKTSRHIPLVFAGGEAEKVARVQEVLPDAAFATWEEIGGALVRALASPPADPVVPSSALAGYAHTPLPQKLGSRRAPSSVWPERPTASSSATCPPGRPCAGAEPAT